jgi:lipopolysaccharide/colanic/teichoic acid biosynthesis glycosyltransferase
MTKKKRFFDLTVALILLVVLIPLIVAIYVLILMIDGRPALFISERMRTNNQGFNLIKFRTMKPSVEDSGVSGGDKSNRITRTGQFLRKYRLDELPQIWNVLVGDISFVGPRPPLRQYVERFPDLYKLVLLSKPGITGMASIYYHKHEEYLLSRSSTRQETDIIYCRNCVPRKAKLDLVYQKNQNICLDIFLMFKTIFK